MIFTLLLQFFLKFQSTSFIILMTNSKEVQNPAGRWCRKETYIKIARCQLRVNHGQASWPVPLEGGGCPLSFGFICATLRA